MKVVNSSITHLIEDTIASKIGDFYFFKDFIIAEFKEESHVSFAQFEDIMEMGKEKYNSKPVGFISNRINSYSVNLIDMFENSNFSNYLSAYAIVSYSEVTTKVLDLEDHYFSIPRKRFNNLIEAANWIQDELEIKKNNNKK